MQKTKESQVQRSCGIYIRDFSEKIREKIHKKKERMKSRKKRKGREEEIGGLKGRAKR